LTLCVCKLLFVNRYSRKLWLNLSKAGQEQTIQGIMLGQKLKELREEHQFVQREVAAKLEIDTAYVSKMENGTKQVSRSWLPILAEMFEVSESELITLWIVDKVKKILKEEQNAFLAIELLYDLYKIDELGVRNKQEYE